MLHNFLEYFFAEAHVYVCDLPAVENSLSKASLIVVAHEMVKIFPKRFVGLSNGGRLKFAVSPLHGARK
jgi:hypothetical protein